MYGYPEIAFAGCTKSSEKDSQPRISMQTLHISRCCVTSLPGTAGIKPYKSLDCCRYSGEQRLEAAGRLLKAATALQ